MLHFYTQFIVVPWRTPSTKFRFHADNPFHSRNDPSPEVVDGTKWVCTIRCLCRQCWKNVQEWLRAAIPTPAVTNRLWFYFFLTRKWLWPQMRPYNYINIRPRNLWDFCPFRFSLFLYKLVKYMKIVNWPLPNLQILAVPKRWMHSTRLK